MQRTKMSGPANQVVYCPAVGYSVLSDTGCRFWLESEANLLVRQLRAAGHHAWAETEGQS